MAVLFEPTPLHSARQMGGVDVQILSQMIDQGQQVMIYTHPV